MITNRFFVFQVGELLVSIDQKMTLSLTKDVKYAAYYSSKKKATDWLSYIKHVYPEATIEEAKMVLVKDLATK